MPFDEDVWVARLDALLDELPGSPTSTDVMHVTDRFEPSTGVAVAARRALAGGGSPTGTAGGVLGGTFPNPTFAVDMATQAELDAAIAVVGGVLFLNVKNYGALGDGTTDDTAAIQDAIDDAGSAGPSGAAGQIVYLPQGVYRVSDSIDNIYSYVRVCGANDNATQIKATSGFPTDGRSVLNLGPRSGGGDLFASTFENMRVNCNMIANAGAITVNFGAEKGGLSRIEVRQCVAATGIYVTSSRFCRLEHIGGSAAVQAILLDGNIGTVYLRDLSIGTTAGGAGTSGVRINSGIVTIHDVYGEVMEHVINFAGGYGGVVLGARGHSSVSGAVLNIDGAMNARPFYASVFNGGAAYTVRDVLLGELYTGDVIVMEDPVAGAHTSLPVGIGSAVSTASSTTISMTVTRDVDVGQFVLVGGNWGGTGNAAVSVTDSQSNTYQLDRLVTSVGSPTNVPGNAVIASAKIATALVSGVDTVTVTVTNSTASKVMCALVASGLTTSSWLDKVASNNANATSPFTSGATATTAQANELLVGVQVTPNDAGETAASPWSQTTKINQGTTRELQLAWQLVSATGAYAFTGTMATAGQYIAAIATYKLA